MAQATSYHQANTSLIAFLRKTKTNQLSILKLEQLK